MKSRTIYVVLSSMIIAGAIIAGLALASWIVNSAIEEHRATHLTPSQRSGLARVQTSLENLRRANSYNRFEVESDDFCLAFNRYESYKKIEVEYKNLDLPYGRFLTRDISADTNVAGRDLALLGNEMIRDARVFGCEGVDLRESQLIWGTYAVTTHFLPEKDWLVNQDLARQLFLRARKNEIYNNTISYNTENNIEYKSQYRRELRSMVEEALYLGFDFDNDLEIDRTFWEEINR